MLQGVLSCIAGIAMLTGDSEPPAFSRPSLNKPDGPAAADKPSPQLQPGSQTSSSKLCNGSFSSDSAHVPVQQTHEAPGTPAQTDARASAVSPQRIPTISPIALPNGISSPTPPPPPRTHLYTPTQPQEDPSAHQAAWGSAGQNTLDNGNASQAAQQPASQGTNGYASQSSSFSSSFTAAQQPSSAVTSQVASSASPASASTTQVWRNNPAYGVPPTPTPTPTRTSSNDIVPSGHRASQSLPSFKGFTSVDRRLTDSWRAKLLEDLADESEDEQQDCALRMALPAVSEHDSLPALTQQWGLQSIEHTEGWQSPYHQAPQPSQHTCQPSAAQTAAPNQNFHSSTADLSRQALPPDDASSQHTAASIQHYSYKARAPPPGSSAPPGQASMSNNSSSHHFQQPQQHSATDRAQALRPQQEATQAEAAAADHTEQRAADSVLPLPLPLVSLFDSNLEVVKARSNMLDIPSAELLDSILDFANAVCGEQQQDTAYSPFKVGLTCLLLPTLLLFVKGQVEHASPVLSMSNVVEVISKSGVVLALVPCLWAVRAACVS